jgi:hypothetical protein
MLGNCGQRGSHIMMKRPLLLLCAFALFAETAVADNGNARLCAKNWATVQNGSGGSFSSLAECASSRSVFQPSLTISPSAVIAGQTFVETGTGFHAMESCRREIDWRDACICDHGSGWFTNADGTSVLFFATGFSGCLTLTLTL